MASVKNVKIADITIPDVRVNAIYDEELQGQLRGSLEVAGQLVPILVIDTGEGYELVDGRHRLEEAIRAGRKTIESKVLPGDSIDALLFNLATNRIRGKTKASEMVTVIDRLVHTEGLDSDQIAARTGLTRDYIERLWKISEADPSIQEALDRELIGVGVAFEVSRLPRREQQENVMGTVHTFHMATHQVKALVDATLQEMAKPAEPTQPKLVPEPEPPRCEVCKDIAQANLLVQVTLDPKCFGKIAYLVAEDKDRQEKPYAEPREGAGA
jgi:ParB/RepB/Spo0J family partition protein